MINWLIGLGFVITTIIAKKMEKKYVMPLFKEQEAKG